MLFTALVFGLAQEVMAVTPTTTVAPLIMSGRQSARPAGTYSPGITEIIKMLDAKIDARVILAYIQNSPIPYNPDATELIALKEHGASTETLVALLHHGDELRLQLAQAQSAVTAQSAALACDYALEEANPEYPHDYPDSADAPSPATDYSYASGWPFSYWPSVRISAYRPYRYEHGCWYPPHVEGHHVGEGSHRGWASAAPPVSQATPSVSAPISGHTSTIAAHSNGSRGSGRSAGQSGGRSR